MNKKIRKIAAILAHIGLILAIVYLGFFIVCSIRANYADAASANNSDLYLSQAMNEHDFSFYTVGRALSDRNDPARENLLITLDLVVPLLCFSSGIILQLSMIRPRRRHKAQTTSQSTTFRR
ncbi:MAG: hypothetical protein IJK54_08285 [Clostridia bacterium]|nr:hypothetical protein [Clostridia bacterium]